MKSPFADIFARDPGLREACRHFPKRVTAGEPIETGGAILKWSALAPDDQPAPEKIDRLDCFYLTGDKRT